MKVLHLRWSKGTDALDAALCSLGVFSRTPKRGSARYSRRRRLTASELVEISGVPPRFRQVMIFYLETYEARVSDAYKTLRHKSIAIAHFWRFMQEKHPSVKHCSAVLPRHVRDYIPYAVARARAVQRGPDTGEEAHPTAYSWLVELSICHVTVSEPKHLFKVKLHLCLDALPWRGLPSAQHSFSSWFSEKSSEAHGVWILQAAIIAENFPSSAVMSIYEGRLRNAQVRVEKRLRTDEPVICFQCNVRQVHNNLVANALEAMPFGGGLLIRSRKGRNWKTQKQGIVLTIADNGGGIHPAVKKHIFDAFFTTKGTVGNGSGLWVCQEIVDRHHCKLCVRSIQCPGRKGTTFTFFLPFDPAC